MTLRIEQYKLSYSNYREKLFVLKKQTGLQGFVVLDKKPNTCVMKASEERNKESRSERHSEK